MVAAPLQELDDAVVSKHLELLADFRADVLVFRLVSEPLSNEQLFVLPPQAKI